MRVTCTICQQDLNVVYDNNAGAALMAAYCIDCDAKRYNEKETIS